jgi:DNA-binding NtrC family response regulator
VIRLELDQRGNPMNSPNSGVPAAAGTAELSGIRVLVVEDSWDVGTGLKMLLEAWGADLAGPVATTADARRLVSERAPDVALVDINLRNGEQSYHLIDWLHEQGVRVVVISGYPDISLAKAKAVAILTKPMREDLLLASLRSVRQR